MALFERDPLPQYTGEIAPRWNQDLSTVRNFIVTVDNQESTALTVTAGKTFYVDRLTWIQQNNAGSTVLTVDLQDGQSVVDKYGSVGAESRTLPIGTPYVFTDSVVVDATNGSNSGTWTISGSGWEE